MAFGNVTFVEWRLVFGNCRPVGAFGSLAAVTAGFLTHDEAGAGSRHRWQDHRLFCSSCGLLLSVVGIVSSNRDGAVLDDFAVFVGTHVVGLALGPTKRGRSEVRVHRCDDCWRSPQ